MTDQELLQAIGQVVEAKLEPVRQDIRELKEGVQRLEVRMDSLEAKVDKLETRVGSLEAKVDKLEVRVGGLETKVDKLETRVDKVEDQVHGIRVYMDTEQRRTLNLLLEGQQALWDRFVPHEEFDPLQDRTEVLEATVRRHSQEIRELQPA